MEYRLYIHIHTREIQAEGEKELDKSEQVDTRPLLLSNSILNFYTVLILYT